MGVRVEEPTVPESRRPEGRGTYCPRGAIHWTVIFNELLELDELAMDCREDGKYDFLHVGSPPKIVQGAGSPVNPIAIK